MRHQIMKYLLICLLMAGCATVKKSRTVTNNTVVKDSTVYIEKVRIDTFKVGADSARIILSPYILRDTVWTYFEKSSGRAKITIQRIRDTVFISGYCDSLQKMFLSTDKTAYTGHSNDHTTTDISTKKTSNKAAVFIVVGGSIFLLFLIVMAVAIKVSIKSIKPI